MPLYDLVCILRATAPRKAVAEVLRRAATTVLDANGVVTDIKNYGTRALAYDIKRSGELHSQARGLRVAARARRAAAAAGVQGWRVGAAAPRAAPRCRLASRGRALTGLGRRRAGPVCAAVVRHVAQDAELDGAQLAHR